MARTPYTTITVPPELRDRLATAALELSPLAGRRIALPTLIAAMLDVSEASEARRKELVKALKNTTP